MKLSPKEDERISREYGLTLGEWRLNEYDDVCCGHDPETGDEFLCNSVRLEGDARLIVASKEMLALLERAEDMTSQANGIAHVSKRLGVAAALADLYADIRALLEGLKGDSHE